LGVLFAISWRHPLILALNADPAHFLEDSLAAVSLAPKKEARPGQAGAGQTPLDPISF
jgi:hypothetical protein